MKNQDTITIIDNAVTVKQVKNFSELPAEVQEAITSAQKIRSYGWQELVGYDSTRKAVWSAGGHWDKPNTKRAKFVVTSIGNGGALQWSNN